MRKKSVGRFFKIILYYALTKYQKKCLAVIFIEVKAKSRCEQRKKSTTITKEKTIKLRLYFAYGEYFP